MLLENQKKLVSLIIGRVKERKPSFVEEIRENKYPVAEVKKDYSNGYEAAAAEMISAVNKNDTIGLAHALKNFFSMCESDMEM